MFRKDWPDVAVELEWGLHVWEGSRSSKNGQKEKSFHMFNDFGSGLA